MASAQSMRLDVRGSCCPLPLIKLAKAMQALAPGETLEVIGNDPIFEPSVRDFCQANGHVLLHATPGEQRAADYVRQQLTNIGVDGVRSQPFDGLRSINLFLALGFGFALMGHAAFWLLRPPLGRWIALLVSAIAFGSGFYLFWRKYTFRSFPLRERLPHGPSQNVLAVLPAARRPSTEEPRRVVLIGHLDVHRAVWWYASDLLTGVYLAATPLAIGGMLLAPICYALDLWFLALPLAAIHFLGWFTGATADLGPNSPGANDNASAIGTLLSLASRLCAAPLQNIEVWLAFTGCEETGAEGMIELLKVNGPALQKALFIDLEMVGIGDQLMYIQQEGIVRHRRISPRVEKLVQEVGQAFGMKAQGITGLGALTEIGPAWERGFDGVCILSRRAASPFLPEWHRLSDIPDRLEPAALEKAHAFVWALLQRLDSAQSDVI